MDKNPYKEISKKYRAEGRGQLSEREVEAYLLARMPATLAATNSVLREVCSHITFPVSSFLDLGAGLGSGALAVKTHFSTVEKVTLVEKNPQMILKGETLVKGEWVNADLDIYNPPPHDLVLFSYSFGELSKKKAILERAWNSAQILIVIEPGTPRGFNHILEARRALIEWGGHLIAPCPHMKKCPMEGRDWCHFSTRLARSKEHRQLKGAERGWEDEKFSYVAFSKRETSSVEERIVRHPQKRSGYIVFDLCTREGLVKKNISRKQGELYKRARKAKWGESIS